MNIDLILDKIDQKIRNIKKMKNRNQPVIDEFRANKGKVGGFFQGKSLLLLHTAGAKTGKVHITPLIYMVYGDRFVIIASKGGAPSNPDWYYNLKENPLVKVELGGEGFEAEAEVVNEPERSQLFELMAKEYPFYAEYQRNTVRAIPVILLSR